ncbi:galactonate dehydratase [Shumkonia mesophila]|uniref:galactonate dehydratase n=1 Tax=Shumkonia mesophila TaxID=2838854 RepID=UPI002934A00C|nr:galactonate dehydratase [Shumkonia mesophila]
MRILRLRTWKVPPRWLFLKIETDAGLAGWGEPVVEGRADTVEAAIGEMADYLVGKDPLRIEDHWQALYRGGFYRGGPVLMSAIAGIDQALWDIKGRYHGAAVHELMGGRCRDRIRVYSWIGGDRPVDLVAAAKDAMGRGFTAVKMNGCEELQIVDSYKKIDAAVGRVATLRDACGSDLDIAIDFHGRVHRPMAKVLMHELEPLRPLFIEEPVLPEHLDQLRDLVRATPIPIATGERLFTRSDFRRLLTEGVADIIQPDLSHAGGITECKKIAAMAEAYDVALAPHCPLGPIALAACLQVDATAYNAFIQEQSLGIHYNTSNDVLDYLCDPSVFAYENGFVAIPEGSGLGIEINEAYVVERAREGHRWRNPIWRHDDGSVAEW